MTSCEFAINRCRYLEERVVELETAIRNRRDQKGDDRCWMDDVELYKILPEGYTPPDMDTAVQLYNCERFIASRQNPNTKYLSPERRIEQLEVALSKVRAALDDLNNAKETREW